MVTFRFEPPLGL